MEHSKSKSTQASPRADGTPCSIVRTVPDCSPADGDPELECPALLNGEEEPHNDPEEEVEDGGDHAREHGAVQGSLANIRLD